ncbi:MAG: glycogen synthase [Fibrobacteria bacterium]|nr:glycogen synthase [Fibrobacteria bacterium]
MYIVMVTPECAPVAKVGGLSDVVQGLAYELSIRGNAVEVILPKYDCMWYDRIWGLEKVFSDLWVPFHDQQIHCDVYFGFMEGVKCFFIDPHSDHNFFNRGQFYGENDDPQRFAFFSKAALEFMLQSGKHPDIIHCHDWQTALLPVLLYSQYWHRGMTHPRVCFTLHNLKHQGITGKFILRQVGLNPAEFVNQERLLDNFNPHAINLMKGGIVYSNFITTVSPNYAQEIQNSGFGYGLQHTLHVHGGKFGGVLNGIDYNMWNPEIDHTLPSHYSADSLDNKYVNKEALRNRLLLQHNYKPIISVVTRLDEQKGVGLIQHGIHYALAHGCQFVLLGTSPDPEINNQFLAIKHQLNNNPDCHLEISYNDELARLIYAGSDMMLVPSAFEPCGLSQMIALKYGTVPIVRSVGGLADTVFDADYSHRPYHERNGYCFQDLNNEGLESAMHRAIGLWYTYPQYFRELIQNGMRYDYSWNYPAVHYLNIFNYIKE